MADSLSEQLADYITAQDPSAGISKLNFLTSGFESDVYTFSLHLPNTSSMDYVLRLFNGEGAEARIIREANGLSWLKGSGVLVPELLWYETDAQILGKPFEIIEKLDGQALWPVLATADSSQVVQHLNRFGALLAKLHQLDWHSFTAHADNYEKNPTLLLDEVISQSQPKYIKHNLKSFIQIFDWLNAHKNEISVRPAIVHQDFHANNVFLCSDDRLFVIDWTQIGVSDYRIDLAWTLMIMGDFGNPNWAKHILEAYASSSKIVIEDLDYFNVIAYTKLLGALIISFITNPESHDLQANSLESLKQQSSKYLSLSERIFNITGIRIYELDAMLSG